MSSFTWKLSSKVERPSVCLHLFDYFKEFYKFDQQLGELYKRLREQEQLNESFNTILMKEKTKRIVRDIIIHILKVHSFGNAGQDK